MRRIIAFQFKKFFKTYHFYMILGIFFMVIFLAAIAYAAEQEFIPVGYTGDISIFKKSGVRFMFEINGKWTIFVYSFFSGLFAIDDYANNTVKIMYAKGYTRTQVFLSRLPVLITATTIYFVINALFSLFWGTYFVGNNIVRKGNYLLMMFMQYIGILILVLSVFSIADIIKNQYAVMISSPLALFVDSILLEILIRLNIEKPVINGLITACWTMQIFTQYDVPAKDVILTLITGIIHAGVLTIISFFINKKAE